MVQDIHDSQAGVETDEIRQSQRTHRNVGSVLHNAVNVLTATDTSLKADNSLVNVRHQNTVGEETGRISRDGWNFAHALDKRDSSVDSLLGGLQSRDNLNTLLDRHGVHEVGRDHARGGLQILGIRRGSGSNLGDGDGRSVGGKNGILGCDLSQLGKDGGLEVWDLGNGLYNKIHGG